MNPAGAQFDFARLLAPVDQETFYEEYWEKRPLIVTRDNPLYYGDLLSLSDVDEILATSSLRSTDVRIVRDGRDLSLATLLGNESYAAGLERLYAQYRDGSTIVLTALHDPWKPLSTLCRALADEIAARFQANAYLTPPNAKGLDVHYDTHDVFVLQVHGRKHWRLFGSPVRLPLPGQPFRRDDLDPIEATDEFDLNTGDLLYIPRGLLHEAVSTEDSSLHVTVGVLSITWAEVILAAVEMVIERDSRLRESVPPRLIADETSRHQAEQQCAILLDAMMRDISPHLTVHDAMERAELRLKPNLHGHLLDLEAESGVSVTTPVLRRDDVVWRLSGDGEGIALQFHGKKVLFPGYLEREMNYMGSVEGSFAGASLPGELDEAGRVALVRRLVREGFLTLNR
jgi:ribosomal protein L16 Arg81 hydroxylase